MNVSSSNLQAAVMAEAYNRAVLFDRMKKNPPEAEIEKKGSDTTLPAELPEPVAAEKPKPNTIPFKPGFLFEYGSEADGGKITVSVSPKAAVKVDLNGGDETAADRRKIIRSLVMLGIDKVGLDEFNGFLRVPEGTADRVRRELSVMGLKPEVPFGLGEKSFYFNGEAGLKEYRPLDVRG